MATTGANVQSDDSINNSVFYKLLKDEPDGVDKFVMVIFRGVIVSYASFFKDSERNNKLGNSIRDFNMNAGGTITQALVNEIVNNYSRLSSSEQQIANDFFTFIDTDDISDELYDFINDKL